MDAIETIERKFRALAPHFDETALRTWAAIEAHSLGRGGVQAVAKAIGMSRTTIYAGLAELKAGTPGLAKSGKRDRVRAVGGGRKKLTDKNPDLWRILDSLIEPPAHHAPAPPLRWTTKSTSRLTDELMRHGYQISQRTICNLLSDMGYRLQLTRNPQMDGAHPDWNSQFEQIAQTVADFLSEDAPIIAIEALKQKPEDEFAVSGSAVLPNAAKPVPEPISDARRIKPGPPLDHAIFVTENIRRWWREMGKPRFARAQRLLVIIDHLSRNDRSQAIWDKALGQLSDELRISITVRDLPPGTRKWTHGTLQMVSQVAVHRHGRPAIQRAIAIQLIAQHP